jgi:hypothetical protein
MKNLTETWYNELLPGFSKLVMNVKTLSVSCWWGWTYIYSHVQLTETRQYTYEAAFGNLIHSTQAAYWKKPTSALTAMSVSRNNILEWFLYKKCSFRWFFNENVRASTCGGVYSYSASWESYIWSRQPIGVLQEKGGFPREMSLLPISHLGVIYGSLLHDYALFYV